MQEGERSGREGVMVACGHEEARGSVSMVHARRRTLTVSTCGTLCVLHVIFM